MANALDFHPEKVPVADFPFPPGSAVRSICLSAVTDRDGFIFLACCTRHEAEHAASGYYAQRDRGRLLGEYEAAGDAPQDCGRDTEHEPLTEADVGTTLDCGCEVIRTSFPCAWHADEYGVAQSDCGDCRFGVPAVYHKCGQ